METVYAAMLLHKAGQKITEEGLSNVLKAAGVKVEDVKVKALVAALEGVNIDEVISKAAFTPISTPAATAPQQAGPAVKEAKPAKKEEEEKKAEEEVTAGLGALFG
ncbi:MAG: 50S ribosomal protein P1 [Candidatus Odinarchaeum yellowstonii]|jgi:large subunit ribosomal protein L12|uniref:Large ribosomal subunit protein P1 n=1 Tax=Odinarchaeota yellowstonii (strain LCB_4) TaxID=1841599 RepID=A0AAF0D3B0_ODILC|nr:MAG: 50S ribosomal protein P1 [Candidatus Odinarchaeum yellowstonii]